MEKTPEDSTAAAERMAGPSPTSALSGEDRTLLRRIALDSILTGLDEGRPLQPDKGALPPSVHGDGATFVTLEIRGQLRGCIGSYRARMPLYEDVARNAFSAAFMDYRFPPLTREELPDLTIQISLLTPLEPLEIRSREELLVRLRPGVDGLLVEDPPHRGTFLPQVWDSLPEPEVFLDELFRKAGLPRSHWSDTLVFWRYTVEKL